MALFIGGGGTAGSAPLADRSVVTSACEVAYPPFCFVDASGQAQGFSVELLQAALRTMGHTVTFRIGTWPEVRGWLEQGAVQALPLVGRTPEREQLFDFTFPYMSLHGALVVRKTARHIHTLDDLRGRRVGVMRADNAEEFLRRVPRDLSIVTFSTFEEALHQLAHRRLDAVVVQRLVALRLLRETGLDHELRVVSQPLEDFRQDFCFAVKDGDRDTLALLNEGLALVMADGTYRHLHAKWFAALELPTDRRLVIGGDEDFPPLEYRGDKGQPTGFSVALVKAVAREMHLDVEVRLGPWSEMRSGLERGDLDALEGVFYSPQRDLLYDFTPRT